MVIRLRGTNGRFVSGGSGAALQVEIDAEKASAALNAFAVAGTYSLMKTLGTLVEGQTKRRIAAEKRAPDGTPWAPLKPSTIARRRKGSKSILQDTGRLLGSISHTASRNRAIIGTSVEYAGFLQGGTKNMVARPFMGISAQNMVEITAAVSAWVERYM